ncbi:MAG: oligosaccharide repeat unit polymerase [Bacteroidales bacterium]|nr:oligosaccharide repeat unit polymerase [Bacteroidales bacterium]
MTLTILLTSLIAIILLFIIKDRSIIEPAKLFSVYWLIQIILIPFLFSQVYEFTGTVFLYIQCACIIFLISSTIGKAWANYSDQQTERFIFQEERSKTILIFISILGLIYPFVQISRYGFGIQNFFNLNQLLEMNNSIAGDRYAGEEQSTLLDQLLLVFVYLAPLYGGYISTFITNKGKWILFIVFIPPLIVALSQAMKAGFIASVFLWFSGKIVSMYSADKPFPKLNIKLIVKISLLIILFFGLLFFSMLLRTDEINAESVKLISYRFINYAFGHLPAIDSWFSNNWNTDFPFELKTFYGISNYLGLANRELGVFTEFLSYGNDKIHEEMVTNVYTVFRFIIEDFGPFGSGFFIAIMGIISGHSLVTIKKRPDSFVSKVVISSFLFFILYSFATSVWAYTSYIVVFIAFYFILRLSYKPNQTI